MDKKITSIPFLLLSFDKMRNTGRRFARLASLLSPLTKKIEPDMEGLDLEIEPADYVIGSVFSAFIYGLVFGLITYGSFMLGMQPPEQREKLLSIAIGTMFFAIFFYLHLIYLSIIKRKIAAWENKDLLFALREMIMNVESGVTLFDAMRNISTGNYGYVSKEFEKTVKKIKSGMYEKDALRQMAIESESEYLRRAVWQIVNSLETGSKVGASLGSITDVLEKQIYREIRNYSANLNFIMLIYMLIAAAIPSLGVTFLVLLSAFSGAGITPPIILGFISMSVVAQIAIIGYAHVTRPKIFGE